MRANEFELDEITGVKKFHDLTAQEVLYEITQLTGLRLIGFGSFGYVMESKDPNWVYKFFKDDTPYLTFVNYVLEHPSIHYPKIKQAPKMMRAFHKRWQDESNNYYVVLMERLKKDVSTGEADFLNELMHFNLDHAPDMLPPTYKKYNRDNITFEQLSETYPWIKTFKVAIDNIKPLLTGKTIMDLHEGNIMIRKDGTYVIIDPLAIEMNVGRVMHSPISNTEFHKGRKVITGPVYKNQS